uniref:Uncharacterized protein n=2 Tax=Tetranychus urticae TaxID=32264 RepID=T1KJ62_TETUR
MGFGAFAGNHNKESKIHPEVDMSKLTIYGNIICPFVRRVLLVLAQKNIQYNFIGIDLFNKPDWFLEMFPNGKVPVLKDGDKVIPESLIIVNYLDDVYPPSVHPSDPYEKAKGSLIVDEIGTPLFTPCLYKCLKDKSLSLEDKLKGINEMFIKIESLLEKKKTKYFQTDDKPVYSDYMVWPFLETTISVSRWLNHPTINSVESVKALYPSVGKYMQLMYEDPAVKKVSPDYDTFETYYNGLVGKN